jgi:hypothetical protein
MSKRANTFLAAAACCGILAACSTHAGATVPPSRYLVCPAVAGPCPGVTPHHEPSSLLMSADGSLYAKDLTWAGWGTTTAVGHGTAEVNDCTPSCAAGTYHGYPATITVTKPQPWHHDMVYSSVTYSIPALDLSRTFTPVLPEPQ